MPLYFLTVIASYPRIRPRHLDFERMRRSDCNDFTIRKTDQAHALERFEPTLHWPDTPYSEKRFGISNDIFEMLQWRLVSLMILMEGTGSAEEQ